VKSARSPPPRAILCHARRPLHPVSHAIPAPGSAAEAKGRAAGLLAFLLAHLCYTAALLWTGSEAPTPLPPPATLDPRV
jgi:hypothetical protein